MTPNYDKLSAKAKHYVTALNQFGFESVTDLDSFREYSVKVQIRQANSDIGNAIIYYKPSKDTFSVKFHEIKVKSFIDDLHKVWDGDTTANTEYECYVDGSFINKSIGYGLVILQNGKLIEERSGRIDDENLLSMHQIAGELTAAMEAVKYCIDRNITSLTLYYDYEGIEKWANGKWKTNKTFTFEYKMYMAGVPVKIYWVKVPAHTGNRWNDKADILAKQATGEYV